MNTFFHESVFIFYVKLKRVLIKWCESIIFEEYEKVDVCYYSLNSFTIYKFRNH